MPEADLLTILEAARFAPSASNSQPWRFVYAMSDTPEWEKMTSVLMGFNKEWAPNAAAMILVYSLSEFVPAGSDEKKGFAWHAFDAGAAWMSIALQAHMLGYHAHAMGGVDQEMARDVYQAPPHAHLHVAVAIGRKGDKATLPEAQQSREQHSSRRPLNEIAAMGKLISE